ncbi:MAG: hypothetical protein M1817_006691 [Caeruleum heppii]|nr:MAG: hypothetical protein M1817_006691 [Caeruleum heppii]
MRHKACELDVSIRLRRAIYLNDLLLVSRIVRNHPKCIRNPDQADSGNTSLHLAAKLGFPSIVDFLLDAGHEDDGISRNAEWETPLMSACRGGSEDVVKTLMRRCERCVDWKNKDGLDALMITAQTSHPHLTSLLLTSPRCDPNAQDLQGNTALHHATAYGELKVARILLQAGADPTKRNWASWMPVSYSASVSAEVYFRSLVAEWERRRAAAEEPAPESGHREEGMKARGGMRLVGKDMDDPQGRMGWVGGRGEGGGTPTRERMDPLTGGLRGRASSGE